MVDYTASETDTPDSLIAGDLKRVTDEIVILSGQVLVRGAVIGKVTASKKFILSLSGAADGSQTPVAVMAEAVDATAGDKRGPAYRTGEFNEAALTLGTGHTIASVKPLLRDAGIHLKKVIG
ncbi:MAG: head decoration protein [Gammaproteobacteria bacterium]|nr:head decoration protein [Gammaproteobacteria bacterium]